MNVQELFGSYNILQYSLCFQAGNHLITFESDNRRVATEEEIKTVCRTVLSQQNINPNDDIVHMLHLGVTAFYSSDEGRRFCQNYGNKADKVFGDEDARAVKKICEDYMSEFMQKL